MSFFFTSILLDLFKALFHRTFIFRVKGWSIHGKILSDMRPLIIFSMIYGKISVLASSLFCCSRESLFYRATMTQSTIRHQKKKKGIFLVSLKLKRHLMKNKSPKKKTVLFV